MRAGSCGLGLRSHTLPSTWILLILSSAFRLSLSSSFLISEAGWRRNLTWRKIMHETKYIARVFLASYPGQDVDWGEESGNETRSVPPAVSKWGCTSYWHHRYLPTLGHRFRLIHTMGACMVIVCVYYITSIHFHGTDNSIWNFKFLKLLL